MSLYSELRARQAVEEEQAALAQERGYTSWAEMVRFAPPEDVAQYEDWTSYRLSELEEFEREQEITERGLVSIAQEEREQKASDLYARAYAAYSRNRALFIGVFGALAAAVVIKFKVLKR
jgi:hypothetical protein